jgi:hypothetical protein
MNYDEVLYLSFNSDENIFYDECGKRIANIFELITPNNLFLFRQNPRYCLFPYIEDSHILCKILTNE